ncbi:phosphate acetyltransferase [Alcanivorax sp. JB21]|uniref:phosphate acetyltransferase n=1 Tax=Alcanivorax limicola TaxID=2874102 RepID=UPI001CBABBE0|nr:phosphate acetyltransferase [Alcanivorax limicola]MBZ2188667.1 phosphate acetyltransferase [Alcanivorax limicola]
MQVFFLAPTGFGVGLTSASLGLIRALEHGGLKVGFCKLIAQNQQGDTGPERSSELVARTLGITPPEPLALAQAERMLSEGRMADLLQEGVQRFHQAAKGNDVVVVEGMVPTRKVSYAERLNAELASSVDGEVILVAASDNDSAEALADRIEINARQFGGPGSERVLGVILNKVRDDSLPDALRKRLPQMADNNFRLLGSIPWEELLSAPRTRDVAELLGADVLHAGDYETRRAERIVLCARAVANTVDLLQPRALIVTPGDRDDIILAASLAAARGVPLAGLLLCTGFKPDPRIMSLCQGALDVGLPVMTVETGSYDTATNLNRMSREIPVDDRERAEQVTDFVASRLDGEWLLARCGTPKEHTLSPSAFRYQMVEQARKANKRIVLPEGAEPRTIQAAVLCQNRGIARCVLLAPPAEVERVARAQGISIPDELEIIDPDDIREQYVAPMVALRKSRGLNEPMALAQLEDTVVLGTMMLAQGDVDGLVSGAINTTANTIRPALQLIKTAPGYHLVSSIFFMLLPQQVLVYGDCAVNPDPTAEELAEIAIQSARSAEAFGIPVRVAMLSYSTGDSGGGSDVEKVREATRLAKEKNPALLIDGPLQYDAAAIQSVARAKAPDSPVAGRATIFIFPDLNTGNTTYKAVQRSANCVSVGPMLQGLKKPVNDLSRGALVEDIVYTIAITAIQAAAQDL